MEDPTVYAKTFELLSFKVALDAKPPNLSGYRIVTLIITREEVGAHGTVFDQTEKFVTKPLVKMM